MADQIRIRGILGGPLERTLEVEITPETLQKLGDLLVKILAKTSKDYFAKRGWSGRDPNGGPPVWRSFQAKVRGRRTLEITSSFYGMAELARGDIPERRMTWLTQEAKDRNPGDYPLTKRERKLGMKQTGRLSRGQRLPLIVPVKTEGGSVEFRAAPLKIADAWVHPGIAKFTFFEDAVRKWRRECVPLVADAVVDALRKKVQ